MTTMSSFTASVKRLATERGAAKVGIADRPGLAGPPEADTEYVLPHARSVVSFLVVEPEEEVLKYLSKEDPQPYRHHFYENIQALGRIGLAVAERLTQAGHRAVALSPNGVYKPGSNFVNKLIPPFSHRYAAVAAGLGCIGWSGNVMTPEYGCRVYLSSVVTDAPLEADGPLDENPCDHCNMCLHSCPGEFMSKTESVTFTLGGREISHAKKGLHGRCGISCGGFSGRGEGTKWGTLAPSEPPIPKDARNSSLSSDGSPRSMRTGRGSDRSCPTSSASPRRCPAMTNPVYWPETSSIPSRHAATVPSSASRPSRSGRGP